MSYELVSVGNPVQVICRAESFNMTVSPVSSAINEATSRVSGTSVTAASLTSVPLATASVTAGGTRKRRSVDVVSPDRVVRQYFFNNSAGNEMFSTILHVVYCTQLFLMKSYELVPSVSLNTGSKKNFRQGDFEKANSQNRLLSS